MQVRHTYIWGVRIPNWGITKYKDPEVETFLLHVPWMSFIVVSPMWPELIGQKKKMYRRMVRERGGKSDYLGIRGQL